MRYESDALAGKTKFAQTSGMLNTSRWGVRGTEDLGNGLKANFQLYAALDREHASTNGGLGAVSGKSSNTGATFGLQTRF